MTNREAIKSLQNIVEYWDVRPTEQEAAKLAIKALKQQDKDQWIPVGERLPDEREEVRDIYDIESLALVDTENFIASDLVLVTVKDNEKDELFVSDDVIVNGKWSNFGAMDTFNVVAWKPMPEPYREENNIEV